MGNLRLLGLAPLYQPQAALAAMQQAPHSFCIHPGCPVCARQSRLQEKQLKRTRKEEARKKILYRKRCKEYTRKFREGYNVLKKV